jgi:acetoin utilization deacetylase AcuC-like enzyme
MKKDKIVTFYDDRMVLQQDSEDNQSKSPLKPKRMMEYLGKNNLMKYFDVKLFEPFEKDDFLIAHTPEYVEAFFNGVQPLCESNDLDWCEQFADSIRYTNASLYNAIRHAVMHPSEVTFSPVSGMHHARPESGVGFCTFSGQVIASVKLYREHGLRGAYVDLDGHYGNSIEDSRDFVPDLNKAVPDGCNINILAWGEMYVEHLKEHLSELHDKIVNGEIDYVVFCHGADSHDQDDYGGGCNTQQWLECSKLFYQFVKEVEKETGEQLPLTLALFGGYRKDHYESVLGLHTADLIECLNTLSFHNIYFKPDIRLNPKYAKFKTRFG